MTEQTNLPWAKRELWTIAEAACLLCGADPVAEKAEFDKKMVADPNVELLYRQLKDATIKGTLDFFDASPDSPYWQRRIDPKKCLAWAINKALGVPELLRELQEMLPAPAEFVFDSDNPLYPAELDVALIAWRAVSKNPEASRSPKEQIRGWLDLHYTTLTNEAKDRISVVCNWDKRGGRPKS